METNKSNKFLIKSKKQMFAVIAVFTLMLFVGGTTYAFFNYTRTGSANTVRTGTINFSSSQTRINLTNVFPIDSSNVSTDTNNVGTATITVTGDTTYDKGIEYLISATNVTNTIGTGANQKNIPISITATASGTLGTNDEDYFDNRDTSNNHIYKVLAKDTVSNNDQLMVGYIAKGATGINGTITIKAYIDKDKILISDTYPEGEEVINGVTYYNGTPTTNKTVLTTTEWNSLNSSGISFQVKVEANEGIWVTDPNPSILLKDAIISKYNGLGQDGLIAININGVLSGENDTIREYRYSGGGRYCAYENDSTGKQYNLQITGNTCPEHAIYGSAGPTSSSIWSNNSDIKYFQGGSISGTTYNLVDDVVHETNLKNYIIFNDELWRIIGVFGGITKIVKDTELSTLPLTYGIYDIKNTSEYTNVQIPWAYYSRTTSSNTITSEWASAGLMSYLNGDDVSGYYGNIDTKYRNLIISGVYNVGIVTSVNKLLTDIYNDEKTSTWNGKVGLLNISDFAYATNQSYWSENVSNYYNSSDNRLTENNWLLHTDAAWNLFINPIDSGGSSINLWFESGNFFGGRNNGAIRPVIFLKSTVKYNGGNGSYNNPYTLKID